MSENYVHEVQDTRLVVQGSRIEFGVYCDWCAGHGRYLSQVWWFRFQVSLCSGR